MTNAELSEILRRLFEAETPEDRDLVANHLIDDLAEELEERIPTVPFGVARSCARALWSPGSATRRPRPCATRSG